MRISISDFIELRQAGYSTDEIKSYQESMGAEGAGLAHEELAAPVKPPTEAPTETPAPTENPNNAPTVTPDPVPAENETQAMLREMLGLMRSNNINSIGRDATPAPDAAEIMASILAPAKPSK